MYWYHRSILKRWKTLIHNCIATILMFSFFAGGSSSDIRQCWVPRVPVSSGDHGADPGAQPRHRGRLQGTEEGEVAEDVCQRLLSSQQESEQIVVNLTHDLKYPRDLICEMRRRDDSWMNNVGGLTTREIQFWIFRSSNMSFLFSNRSSKTFKPKKNIPEGSHQHELMKHANATLGSGATFYSITHPKISFIHSLEV